MDMILILSYSNEYALEMAKRLRAEQIYSRIVSGMTTAAQIRALSPQGIIMTGEAKSSSGVFDAGILELGIPVLALGHAAHMLLAAQGGASADVALSERKTDIRYGESALFRGLSSGERYIKEALMLMLPPDVQMSASAGGCTLAFERADRKQYGVQFELERNDPEGAAILKNFALEICGCAPWWTLDAALEEARRTLQEAAEQGGRAVCAVSGGVDSSVAAVLTHEAFGERMTAVFVDTGLMREGESDAVVQAFEQMNVPLLRVDRSGVVLEALAHRQGMDEKRSVVAACLREEMLRQFAAMPGTHTLVLGDNYSDAIQSRTASWEGDGMSVVCPLSTLLKDEIRAIARRLGLDESIARRKPFPALGLGARIIGEVTQERLHALRVADSIFREEIVAAGQERRLHKFFPVLTGGIQPMDGEAIILRAVTISGGQLLPARLPHDLLERTTARILESAPQVTRVLYDETPSEIGREKFA